MSQAKKLKTGSNAKLTQAKRNKQDEFYTQYTDIEAELKHYKEQFENKIVYCNCDDPSESNFFKYFSLKFEELGLKKLITTCYKNQNRNLFSKNDTEKAIYSEYNGGGNRTPNLEDINIKSLKGDGDFRREETTLILKQADIVVTNPPFSLFREYMAQLIKYDKKFLIIGNQNAIGYKEIFKAMKEDKLWLGKNHGAMEFRIPDHYVLRTDDYRLDDEGKRIIQTGCICWLTNLEISKRYHDIILYKNYNPKEYPKYDNYDAINVDKIKDIPKDYAGIMGVPISFLHQYNPNQFELLGMASGRDEFEAIPVKKYRNPKQLNPDDTVTNGSKLNTGCNIAYDTRPTGVCYTADNAKGFLKQVYKRILVRVK